MRSENANIFENGTDITNNIQRDSFYRGSEAIDRLKVKTKSPITVETRACQNISQLISLLLL
jgi:hypothetical protein